MGKSCWHGVEQLLSQFVYDRARARESAHVCVRAQQRPCNTNSRLGNYGYNTGLSSKSSFRQNTRVRGTIIIPARELDAQSNLPKHADDGIKGALSRLQGVREICLCPVMSQNMLLCHFLSYTKLCVSLPCDCLQVTLLTESSRRLTSFTQADYTMLLGSVTQLNDNLWSRPLCQSILKCTY